MKQMKIYLNLVLFLLAFFFKVTFCFSQCAIGNAILHGQGAVNAFPSSAPGCANFTGSLRIISYPGDPVTSLAPLSQIQRLQGTLTIENCAQLSSLTGLHNLEYALGLNILYNNAFTTLSGLEGLDSVEAVLISNQQQLISLTGLDNLAWVGYVPGWLTNGSFTIHNCDNLTSLSVLSTLTHVKQLQILDCDNLSSLNGLHNIDPLSLSTLTLTGNTSLSQCEIASICGYLGTLGLAQYYTTINNNLPGCNSAAEVATACAAAGINFVTVSPSSISPTNTAGNTSIAVSSNVSWTATESVGWLSLTLISGGFQNNGNGSFTINHSANTGSSPRTGTVTVSGLGGVSNQTITVTQAGATATNFLTVSPSSISPTNAAGNTSIAVSSNVSWTASESVSWLTISGGSGSNNGSFTINHTVNTSTSPRTATVTVSGSGVSNQTITVTQAGATATNILTVSPSSISPTSSAGNTSIAVSSNVSWTASESVSWLTISGGSGSNNGSFTIITTANTSTSPRTATVTVSGAGVSNQTITVTQAGATVTNILTVSPSSISPTSSAGNTSIAVSSNVSWTASESISWLTISGGSGSNNGLFTINHTANNNAGSRTATVTVSGSGVSNQTVTVTQAGSSTTPPYTWIPTNQSGVFQGQAQVTGIGATSSDWIAAIDQNGNTAGATQIIVNAGIGYINLPIYGDDPTTPSVDEGMSAGEYFTLQLYDASTGTYRDYPTSATKFQFTQWSNTNGTPIAGYDNPSTVYNFLETVSDTINLNPGWNLVSTDVIPTDSTISSVFASLISSNNLIYVTGFDNGTKFYDPNGLSFFNTLNHMKRGLGVWVKVTNAATLVITGDPILSSYKSNLNAGWNLVSFIPQTQESPSTYYSNLVNSNNLIYVTGFDNGTQFYDPNGLSFFNTLQFLRNSFGYWVKVNTSVGGNSYRGDGFLPTNIYNFFNGSSNLEEYVNEEVNIYTQSGELCGKLVILENGYLMTTSVYGDDALTTIIDGVPVGEGLLFEFRGQMLDVGITFNGDMGHHYLDLQFDTDALTGTDMIGEYLMAFSCYPNPFSSTLNISYTLTETTETVVRVHNALGQEVEVIKNEQAVAGEHIVQWDASQELLGLYFISLEINGQVVTTQKVLLRR